MGSWVLITRVELISPSLRTHHHYVLIMLCDVIGHLASSHILHSVDCIIHSILKRNSHEARWEVKMLLEELILLSLERELHKQLRVRRVIV